MNDKCVVVQCPVMSRRVVVGRSTKGASRQRRSLINGEILSLRQLLPVSDCTRQRLSQLQTMSLACIFIRKYQLLGASSSECLFIRTVRIVCGAGSMKRYGVRPSVRPFVCPSVCPSMGPQQQTPCCSLLLWTRWAVNIDRLLQQRRVNAGSATLSACVGS